MNAAITVQNLKKCFGVVETYQDFSVVFEENKITTIFGPNGSGKTTLLNILSGTILKDGGDFHIKNFNSFEFSYIFQNYRESLLPWRTNFENVALPLQIQRKNKGEIGKRIEELQKMFDIKFKWNQYPYELSGGQQQILAFMRALIIKPKILFIDEPFSALDYENNLLLRKYLQQYHTIFKPTILLVTHNIEEAVHLGEKIIVLSRKPTKVIEIIDNPMPYPRMLDFLKHKTFHSTKEKVLSAFRTTTGI